jgi:hypothetical protein
MATRIWQYKLEGLEIYFRYWDNLKDFVTNLYPNKVEVIWNIYENPDLLSNNEIW